MNKEMKGGAGKTRTLLLSIFLFLCIYAPPILPDINLILVIAVLSIPYLLLHSRTCLRVLSSSPAKSFIAWFASFVCYWLVITFLNVLLGEGGFGADYTTSAYSFFLVLPVCLICSTAAMVYKENNGLSMGQVIKAFIVAGLIQAAFALAAFFDPGVKSFLTEIMFENTGTEQMQSGLWIADRRFYGFANSMLDLYGLGTGLIAALPAFLVQIDRNASKCWLVTIPVLLVVPALNARTGLVVFFVALVIASLYAGRASGLSIVATMFAAGAIFAIAAILINVISLVRPEVIDWLLGDITGGTQHNTFEVLFSESFWSLPEPLLIITGTGHSVYGVPGFSHSDVGYVNEIWRTGIIGLIMLALAFIRPVMRSLRKTSCGDPFEYLLIGAVVCLAITAVKCMPITHSGGMIVLLTLILIGGRREEMLERGAVR